MQFFILIKMLLLLCLLSFKKQPDLNAYIVFSVFFYKSKTKFNFTAMYAEMNANMKLSLACNY